MQRLDLRFVRLFERLRLGLVDRGLAREHADRRLHRIALVARLGVARDEVSQPHSPIAELLLWPSTEMAACGVLKDLLFAASVAVAGGVAAARAKTHLLIWHAWPT